MAIGFSSMSNLFKLPCKFKIYHVGSSFVFLKLMSCMIWLKLFFLFFGSTVAFIYMDRTWETWNPGIHSLQKQLMENITCQRKTRDTVEIYKFSFSCICSSSVRFSLSLKGVGVEWMGRSIAAIYPTHNLLLHPPPPSAFVPYPLCLYVQLTSNINKI